MINRLKIGLALIAGLSVYTGAVQAKEYSGSVELGFLNSNRSSTDTLIEEDDFRGAFVGGYITTTFDKGIKLTGDARYESVAGATDVDDSSITGPLFAGVYALHAGKEFGDLYFGAFGGFGSFHGYENTTGDIFGIEAEYSLNEKIDIFAQLAEVYAIGDPDDNEFIGGDGRLGVSAQVQDDLNIAVAYEFAQSQECFEDCGDSTQGGKIKIGTIDATYALNDQVDLIAGYEYQSIEANTEDNGYARNISLGLRIALSGEKQQAYNLYTPLGGFHAAGWMAPLD